jgi:nitrate reductase assembly molybdenum cofactor insertion protein NarJ
MTGATQSDPRVADHLRRAARLRLLALAFESPRAGWQEEFSSQAEQIGEADLRQLAEQARQEATPELHHTIFGPGGPAAPREVSYVDTILPGQFMADLHAFYDAFAYHPTVPEPPDHVAVELAFLSYLHLKIAYAIARDDQQQADISADAAKRFSASHLSNILGPLTHALEASGIGYFQSVAASLRKWFDLGSPV